MKTEKKTYTQAEKMQNSVEGILKMKPPTVGIRDSEAKPNEAALTNCYLSCRRDENYNPTESTLFATDEGVGFDFDYYALMPIEQLQDLIKFAQSGQVTKENS